MLDETYTRRDVVTLPTFWVAIALSVLFHILVLGKWLPQVRLPSLDELALGEASRSLVVNLAPPSAPRPPAQSSPSSKAAPAPALQSPPPKAAARPRSAPPVLALDKRAPEAPPAQPIAPPAPAADLSTYIEAQRRARLASAPQAQSSPAAPASRASPAEDESGRADRAVAANLGLNRAPTYGPDPTRSGGGIFQIQRLGYNDAEFYFYGWNKDIKRNTTQLVEVTKGNSGDIRLAVVRRMISIIREHEQEDFLWESPRLGRSIMLSARQRDNAGLEEFMLREFFSGAR